MASNPGIILYRGGAIIKDYRIGLLQVHAISESIGVQEILVPEPSIFLIESDVMTQDLWEGIRIAEHQWMAGDVQFLPGGTEVSATYVSNLYSETMIRIPEHILAGSARGHFEYSASEFEFMEIKSSKVFRIGRLLWDIAASLEAHPMLIEAITNALSVGIICGISDRANRAFSMLPNGLSRERRARSLDYIEQNLSRQIRLEQIADAASLSTYHFSRSFKAEMGIPPVRYILMRRLEMAKKMLSMTVIPLASVALACGFSSQSHFATAFKGSTGMAPGAFRRAST